MKYELGTEMENKSCYLYLRVSSDEQIENFSLTTQEEICRREAEKRGFKVDQVYREEGRSAKNIDGRPQLLKLLEDARKSKAKIHAIFIYRIDRLSRSNLDYAIIRKTLSAYGIAIISCSEPIESTPVGMFVENLFASLGELDNAIKGERSKNGLRKRFESGLPWGNPLLGYKKSAGNAWQPDPETFDKVKAAWMLLAGGTVTLRQLAETMNSWGLVRAYRGNTYPLNFNNLNRIFRNKIYIGVLSYSAYNFEVPCKVLSMITEDVFYRAQAVLDGRSVSPSVKRVKDRDDFPLRRLVKCGICGSSLTAGWSKGKKKSYAYYLCSKNGQHKSIPAGVLETAMVEELRRVQPATETLQAYLLVVETNWKNRISEFETRQRSADGEILEAKAMRMTIAEKNAKGLYSDELFKELNAKLEDRIIVANTIKNENILDKYKLEEVIDFTRALLSDLGKAYIHGSLAQKRTLLCSIWPAGLAWGYPGFLNTQIDPMFSYIRSFAPEEYRDVPRSSVSLNTLLEWIVPLMDVFGKKPAFAYA